MKEELIRATCLSYEMQLQGMIADNKIREMNGYSLPYGEEQFLSLQQSFENTIHELKQGY